MFYYYAGNICLAHKSEVIWIGDRLMKVGNTDVSKGTIYDVPGIIANMKRPIIMILNGEHDVEWEKMDNLAVAIAMINKIQHQSKKDFNYSSMINIEQKPVGKSVIPPSPSKLVRKSLQSFVRKRYVVPRRQTNCSEIAFKPNLS